MSPRHQLQDAAGDRKTEGGLFFSVAVPCYNEEPVIAASYRRLKATCQAQGAGYEIIFGNDGSSDGTPGILEEIAAADSCVKVTSHYPNRGAGYTYREMYEKARGEIIIQTDADLAMPPEVSVPALLGALEGADVAVGSWYVGVEADYPLKRRLFSRGYIILNRALFGLGVEDTQTGTLGFHRRVLPLLDLQADGFEMLLEFIARAEAAGFEVAEVGLPWVHDTKSGETNVWKESMKMLAGTLKVRWRLGGTGGGHRGGAAGAAGRKKANGHATKSKSPDTPESP